MLETAEEYIESILQNSCLEREEVEADMRDRGLDPTSQPDARSMYLELLTQQARSSEQSEIDCSNTKLIPEQELPDSTLVLYGEHEERLISLEDAKLEILDRKEQDPDFILPNILFIANCLAGQQFPSLDRIQGLATDDFFEDPPTDFEGEQSLEYALKRFKRQNSHLHAYDGDCSKAVVLDYAYCRDRAKRELEQGRFEQAIKVPESSVDPQLKIYQDSWNILPISEFKENYLAVYDRQCPPDYVWTTRWDQESQIVSASELVIIAVEQWLHRIPEGKVAKGHSALNDRITEALHSFYAANEQTKQLIPDYSRAILLDWEN